jgi:hypothetical protein
VDGSIPELLAASAREAYRYLGQEFIYREDSKKLFPAALGVELRLCGCDFTVSKRDVLYKGQSVDSHTFEFSFPDGAVAQTAFYKKPEQLQEACDELAFHRKAFGLAASYLVAFPEKEADEVRIITV